MLYPTLVVAILAAIVASQAIITATFQVSITTPTKALTNKSQLITQIMKLSYFPQIKVVHTSKIFFGQVYVPMLNWLMMIGTILVAAIYNNTTSLGNAYGVCVIFVTFFDSCMVALAAILVWRIRPIYVLFPFLVIVCIDGAFLSSALVKVPEGAWFTLTLASILAGLFILWRYGKQNQWLTEAGDRFKPASLVEQLPDGRLVLTPRYGGGSLGTTRGFAIFFDKAGEMSPTVWIQFLTKLVASPEVTVFFHLRPLETPSVPLESRYTVTAISDIPDCYRLVVRHGYMDEVITPDLASLVFEQVRDFLLRKQSNMTRIAAEDKHLVQTAEKSDTSSSDAISASNVPLPQSPTPLSPTSLNEGNPEEDKGIATALAQDQPIHEKSNLHLRTILSNVSNPEHGLSAQNPALYALQRAFDTQALYIIGKESLKIRPETNIFKKIVLKCFLFIRENTRSKIANLRVPVDKVVEVGFVKDM